MDKYEKAIKDLLNFLSNIRKNRGRTGIRVEGKGNIIINNYVEGYDNGIIISGVENIAIDNEVRGSNYDEMDQVMHKLLDDLDRKNQGLIRKRVYDELKKWAPTIATVTLRILSKYDII